MKGRKFESSAARFLYDRYVGRDPERIAAYENEVLNAEIARKIFEMRTKAGLSQRELAARVGTSASAICRLEDGDYEGHSLSLVKRIAEDDIGHVPFGHTLEDEMAGIYKRHDSLAGPRLYEMLFNDQSDLRRVFSDSLPCWIGNLANADLAKLIYVILSWKEKVDPSKGFETLLAEQLQRVGKDTPSFRRITCLKNWHQELRNKNLFHPFMSDVIGNTICADLLDYLPRDRKNLGMEPRFHARLQRYFTIREGTLYAGEGLRVSIMVTRKGRGGQRRDVATAVLDIMRERYEMAERVFYHHKKAAASVTLAKLVELAGSAKPRDDEGIYPAPWDENPAPSNGTVPHMAHLSDVGLIDYLGAVPLESQRDRDLQRRLHAALRFRRASLYRTLLVIDSAVPSASKHPISYFACELRGAEEEPTNQGRLALERELAKACRAEDGDVLIYCPNPDMQSKEVDARLEIVEDRILPLRKQAESFAYQRDIEVLRQYYGELWRVYVFVSPEIFEDVSRCKAIVDALCQRFGIPEEVLYSKVRSHELRRLQGAQARAGGASKKGATERDHSLAALHGALVVALGDALSADDQARVDEWASPRLPLDPGVFTEFLKALPNKQSLNRPTSDRSSSGGQLVPLLEQALRRARRQAKAPASTQPSEATPVPEGGDVSEVAEGLLKGQ